MANVQLARFFLLGAGRPARGYKPSPLKFIAKETRVLDWQLDSFRSIDENPEVTFVGGYHVEDVIEDYPALSFSVVADWEYRNVVDTFFSCSFSLEKDNIVTYADTVFRPEALKRLYNTKADLAFCVDSNWVDRYSKRVKSDIESAETISPDDFLGQLDSIAEFTGLMIFKKSSIPALQELQSNKTNIVNLIDILKSLAVSGLTVEILDIGSKWAELNDPADVAGFILGTKAETLDRLETLVKRSKIGSQVTFTAGCWVSNKSQIISKIANAFGEDFLIVRSSSSSEDNWDSSNAGGFESVLNVDGSSLEAITDAVSKVIESYGINAGSSDQVLVQSMVTNVRASGVLFTRGLETGAPYYRINFDDKTSSTESVTAGNVDGLRTVIVHREHAHLLATNEPDLHALILAISEIEHLLSFDKLDVEFAIDTSGRVHIFQVRPIVVDHSEYEVDDDEITMSLTQCIEFYRSQQVKRPHVFGNTTMFGNMPDWNPAEIIGVRPHSLAASLYRHLITDEVWATQRYEYGYRDVRPYPLLVSFAGQPYIDIRASLNSFIPANLSAATASTLINAYMEELRANPHFHDKIEFEVAFTAWSPNIKEKASARLIPHGVTTAQIDELVLALKDITRNGVLRLQNDVKSANSIRALIKDILDSDLPPQHKAFDLLDVCKRHGTLAFSHAARGGFVAKTLLKAFVEKDFITPDRYSEFLGSVKTVATELESDLAKLSSGDLELSDLVENYGHLRPGTYEVCAMAYWENADQIFGRASNEVYTEPKPFIPTPDETLRLQAVVDELGGLDSVEQLITFMSEATRLREAVKFEFTRALSAALSCCIEFGNDVGISREHISFMEFGDLYDLRMNNLSISELRERCDKRRQAYLLTTMVELPTLISAERDILCFELMDSQPNFVTTFSVEADAFAVSSDFDARVSGKIAMIENADPGYDWLFGQNIVGLVTCFGGANSHMAIRSAELGLPAVIGLGDKAFGSISKKARIYIDCGNKIIRSAS